MDQKVGNLRAELNRLGNRQNGFDRRLQMLEMHVALIRFLGLEVAEHND